MMSMMSIRALNANISAALAKVEAGETLEITRNGQVIAEIRPKRQSRLDDPEFKARWDRFMEGLDEGVPGLTGPATYEERTGR
jgi:antitoxin (DNA-binding transcriptional repressor) of toxin-antitoxin stability system